MSDAKGCPAHGKGAYFRPSIEYSAHNRYARVITIKNRRNEEFYMQAIFQCHLNPDSFIERVETLLKKGEKMVRITKQHPMELPQSAWLSKCHFQI
jgi:hypothetical protein